MFCCINCGHKVCYCFFIQKSHPEVFLVLGAQVSVPLQQWNCLPRSQLEVSLVLGAQISVPGTMELCAPTVEFLPEP